MKEEIESQMSMNKIDVPRLVDNVLDEYRSSPVILLPNETPVAEITYLTTLRMTYIRTIEDVLQWTKDRPARSIKILEIGAFLGLVSVCLARLGYQVIASDIPDFINNESLQKKFTANNIHYFGVDLSQLPIPRADSEFDIVIMCEVIEHLNFNPLPVLQDINRIIKSDGIFYLSLPNIASLKNRVLLLRGRSIHNPIEHLRWQLDPDSTMKLGLHWREYTLREIDEMLEMFGFKVEKHYYFDWFDKISINERKSFISLLKFIPKKILYFSLPDLKENQTVIAKKTTTKTKE